MNTKVISREQAIIEVTAWLDHKKMSDRKRESNKESIEALTDAVEDGLLVLDQGTEEKEGTFEWKQLLKFPVGEIKELNFKARMPVGTIHVNLSGTKSDDGDARILAYVAALSGQNSGIIRKLDTEDYSVSKNIAYFFL